jgi:hypothetical protein
MSDAWFSSFPSFCDIPVELRVYVPSWLMPTVGSAHDDEDDAFAFIKFWDNSGADAGAKGKGNNHSSHGSGGNNVSSKKKRAAAAAAAAAASRTAEASKDYTVSTLPTVTFADSIKISMMRVAMCGELALAGKYSAATVPDAPGGGVGRGIGTTNSEATEAKDSKEDANASAMSSNSTLAFLREARLLG